MTSVSRAFFVRQYGGNDVVGRRVVLASLGAKLESFVVIGITLILSGG
ncbi:hypothetical protein MSG34_04845 [Vibrio sp. 1CM2L]|nr:hypothetical protein [Vibrio sp. 1CM2L]MCK8075476.1 hypothetical protein [Vibrio sp. 1CM2L]